MTKRIHRSIKSRRLLLLLARRSNHRSRSFETLFQKLWTCGEKLENGTGSRIVEDHGEFCNGPVPGFQDHGPKVSDVLDAADAVGVVVVLEAEPRVNGRGSSC
jgi:hypothetical protein